MATFVEVKKAPALITIAIIASTVALTFYLSLRREKKSLNNWDLVSPASVGVLETFKPEAFQKLKTDTARLLDLIIAKGRKKEFADPYLFAFQSVGKELGWVVILPKQFPSLLDTLANLKMSVKKRTYEGKTLYDIYRGDVRLASLTEIDGIWSASKHAILVEATVRQNQVHENNFRKQNFRLFSLPAVKQDDGNFYLGNTSFFHRSTSDVEIPLSHSVILDLRWADQVLMASGFATDTTSAVTLLSLFNGQQPVSLDLRKILPDDLQSVIHFGFSDARRWFQNREAIRSNQQKSAMDSAGFQIDVFATAIDNEMLYCRLEDGAEIVLIEVKEITKSQAQLDKIRTALAQKGLYEGHNYANRVIHTLRKADVIAPLVWPIKMSSPETSYAVDGNVLLIAPLSKTIERFISLTDTERTTGKSLAWQRFLETTLTEANVSFLTNSPPADYALATVGLPSLLPIDKLCFQFYSLEGNHYASGSVQFAGITPVKKATDTRVVLNGTTLLKPALVRNYLEKQGEILVQDSLNTIQLIDGRGQPRWLRDLHNRITTSVDELDYLKNGKIQFLFCTPGQIHLIDRLGNNVPGFPKPISMKEPRWLSVVDYDNSRNYRMLIADDHGDMLLVDKEAKPLTGWSPKSIGRPFADAPGYHRIRSKDYFLAVTVDGDIHLFNRRGERTPGFPVKTKIIPSGDVACDDEAIAMVSQDGILVKYDTKAERYFEEPLLKNVQDARFKMAVSRSGDFVVTRSERGNLALFDEDGKQKFEIVNPLSDRFEVQFFEATREKSLVIVRDIDQDLLLAVDLKGQLLTKQPVQATQPPAVDYDRDGQMVRIFIVNNDRIEILRLPF